MRPHPSVSVAIPVYNEEDGLPELLRRTAAVLDELPGGPHEMVFVDDGSDDRSLEILEEAARSDSRIVVVAFSRNFGHQIALTAALDHVRREVAVLMDGDLQDPPERIPLFLEKYREGYDVVYARRTRRKEGLFLRASYHLYYRLVTRLANVELPLDAGDFGLLSERVVRELRRAPERHRYLRGLRAWAGFRQIGIDVERDARVQGASKYNLGRLLGLAFDGLFAFSVVPLRLAAVVGALAILASAAFSLYSVYAKLVLDRSPQGFTAIILVVSFVSGVILLFLGVIGEYVGRTYEEVKRRPLYIVARIIGRDDALEDR